MLSAAAQSGTLRLSSPKSTSSAIAVTTEMVQRRRDREWRERREAGDLEEGDKEEGREEGEEDKGDRTFDALLL